MEIPQYCVSKRVTPLKFQDQILKPFVHTTLS